MSTTGLQPQASPFGSAPVPESLFADVGTNLKSPEPGQVDRRATRWGFRPIWDILELPGAGFLSWDIPANTFRPFRLFQFPVTNSNGQLMMIDRFPADQVQDMINTVPYFIDFYEVAKLENEDIARGIFEALANPHPCSKYPFQLRNKCATCWLNYLRSPEASAALNKFVGVPYQAAVENTYLLLTDGLEKAIVEAERQVDDAEALIADSSSSKTTYVPHDITNIQHTHNEMPDLRRTGGVSKTFATELAAAFKGIGIGGAAVGSIPPEVIEMMARMQNEIDTLKAAQGVAVSTPIPADADDIAANQPDAEDEKPEIDLGMTPDPIEEVVTDNET